MGYARRVTFGKCDCRPKEFKNDKFQLPNFLCSSHCIYYIFCMTELKTSLGDRIKQLRLSFQKPYYFFSLMTNGDIMIIFEDDEGRRTSFRGKTILESVNRAENYLKSVSFGDKKEKDISEENKPPKEDDAVIIETKIKDDKGNEFRDE